MDERPGVCCYSGSALEDEDEDDTEDTCVSVFQC